jgi:hypothetical protein
VRHNFVFNFSYALPFGGDSSGLSRAALAGWQVSGILTLSGGNPRSALLGFNRSRNLNALSSLSVSDRPNVKAGADTNPVAGGVLNYWESSSFELSPAGTQGNVGRNTLITPGQATFDMSLVKNIALGGERSVQLRAEFFNLFNRANFGTPTTSVFTSATGPNPSFGRITSTSTSARQGQLAVKLLF